MRVADCQLDQPSTIIELDQRRRIHGLTATGDTYDY
jgi:hypothetical protein